MFLRPRLGTIGWLLLLCLCQQLPDVGWVLPASAAEVNANNVKRKSAWQPAPLTLPSVTVRRAGSESEVRATKVSSWSGAGKPVAVVCFDHSGQNALAVLADGTCHVLDPGSGKSLRQWQSASPDKVVAAEITWDGQRVVLQCEGAKVLVRDMKDGTLVHSLNHSPAKVSAIAVGADPTLMAVGTDAGIILLWDIKLGQLNGTIYYRPRVTALEFSPDCRRLFAGCDLRSSLSWYEMPSCKALGEIEQTGGPPARLACSSDGNVLVALSEDRIATATSLKKMPGSKLEPPQRMSGTAIRRGVARQWFPLPDGNSVCSYLGETGFEYYDIESNGASGTQPAPKATPGPLTLSRNGQLAASAHESGVVDFYQMPGPYKTATVKNADRAKEFKALLESEKYDDLEEQANQALADTTPDATLTSPAQVFSDAWEVSADTSPEGWSKYLAALEAWVTAKPDSVAARLAFGRALITYGWSARGNADFDRTAKPNLQTFYEQLKRADEVLIDAFRKTPTAPVCAAMITVAMARGKPLGERIALWERGLKDAPNYAPLHRNVAYSLLPRWGARKGDVATLGGRALKELPEEQGALAYALMAAKFLEFEYAPYLEQAGFKLDPLNNAAQAALRAHPESLEMATTAAVVACLRADQPSAARSFTQLAGRYNLRIWNRDALRRFRDWSRAQDEELDEESAFLASWINVRSIAFDSAGTKLLTLCDDLSIEVHSWDVSQKNAHEVSGISNVSLPGFLSRHGRWVYCPPRKQDGPVMLMERDSGKVISWPNATGKAPAWISDDEQQLAVYGEDKKLVVFELDNPLREPLYTIPLSAPPVVVEFPCQAKSWRIMVQDKSNIRVLSNEGQDLVGPIKDLARGQRFRAIPQSSLVLVGGPGLLGLFDADTGAATRLVDVTNDKGDRYNYVGLAASSDGTLVAAARHRHVGPQQSWKAEVEIWDVGKKQKVHVLRAPKHGLFHVSFSTDGKRLAGAEPAGFVHIWNVEPILNR